jgi:DnaJ-class molecular chaperone
MSHAEVCPVCDGEGKVAGILPNEKNTCHGCAGKGWVAVQDPVRCVPAPPLYSDPSWKPYWKDPYRITSSLLEE